MSRFCAAVLLAIVLQAGTNCPLAQADLAPEEIGIVVARANKESMGLARYYCRQRAVPTENLIEVDVPPGEVLDREKWRWAVRPEIREWLAKNDPDRKLRCLVTTWGIPLKITAGEPAERAADYQKYLEDERATRAGRLDQIAKALERLGGDGELAEAFASLPENKPAAGDLKSLKKRLESALIGSQKRLNSLPPDQRRQMEAPLQRLATGAGGARVLLQGINQRIQNSKTSGEEVPPEIMQQFNVMRGRAGAFTELRLLLDSRPPSFERDEITLRMLEQTGGLLGTIEWLDKQIRVAKQRQTGASFDSELSLVLWPDGYELLRWQPNYLRAMYDNSKLRTPFPTLMVSRLDGPDLKNAKRLIDDALAVEKAGGLKGKVYLDARGLTTLEGPPHEPGSYPDYDRALMVTAKGIGGLKDEDDTPRFDVTLNELPELFAPGQCPETALYCGWYSLAKYVDAFDFNKGAVAYHLASSEAVTLKEIDSQCWCKKLLQDGVCATLGPVDEPYLLAFPRPNEFFALLIQGKMPLAEVYYRTKPFNSWQMTLIGDPLYRPFVAE